MIHIFRQHQQSLLVALTIVVIIAFVWLYNTPQFERTRHSRRTVATVLGRNLTQEDLERHARRIELAAQIGFQDYYRYLGGTMGGITADCVFNRLVARHEADALQIGTTTDAVVEAIQRLQIFQTNGVFDPQKYALFTQNALAPRGMTETQFEELVRDAISLRTLRALLGATLEVSPAEVETALNQQFETHHAAFIRFSLEPFLKEINPDEETLKKVYETRKADLKSEEKRCVKFVKLALTPEQEKATGNARTDALQQLARTAEEFTQAIVEEGAAFDAVAARFGLQPQVTGDFTAGAPDPALKEAPRAVQTAFMLTEEDPNSDAVQESNAFYILHLEKIVPAAPLSFDEARPRLVEQVKRENATERLATKAGEYRTALETAIKSGKSFAEAAQAAGLTSETIPPFSIHKLPDGDNVPRDVLAVAIETPVGEISGFLPTEQGGYLVFVEKREPGKPDEMEKDRGRIASILDTTRSDLLYLEWLRQRRAAAGARMVTEF